MEKVVVVVWRLLWIKLPNFVTAELLEWVRWDWATVWLWRKAAVSTVDALFIVGVLQPSHQMLLASHQICLCQKCFGFSSLCLLLSTLSEIPLLRCPWAKLQRCMKQILTYDMWWPEVNCVVLFQRLSLLILLLHSGRITLKACNWSSTNSWDAKVVFWKQTQVKSSTGKLIWRLEFSFCGYISDVCMVSTLYTAVVEQNGDPALAFSLSLSLTLPPLYSLSHTPTHTHTHTHTPT